MKNYIFAAALAVTLMLFPYSARAQNKTTGPGKRMPDISFTYSALRVNVPVGECGCFWMRGGSGELAVPVWRQFSVVAQVSGELEARLPGNPGIGLSLASAMGGARLTHNQGGRWSPFAQGLFGVAHGFDSYFPDIVRPKGAATWFAMAAGLGLDVKVSRHLLLRPLQAEYQYMQLPNNAVNPSDQQHDIRLSAGVVFRLAH